MLASRCAPCPPLLTVEAFDRHHHKIAGTLASYAQFHGCAGPALSVRGVTRLNANGRGSAEQWIKKDKHAVRGNL